MTAGTELPSGLLRRWLTAIGLLGTAEELLGHQDDAASSTALIAADSATETLLGIIGSWADGSLPREPKYDQIIERASRALRAAGKDLPPALQQDLRSVHLLRNAVVHHGALGPASEASLACRVARELLDLVSAVSAQLPTFPAGGGILHAIAAVLDAPDLTEQLLAGVAALTEGKATEAADAAARAHTMLLFRMDPPVGEPPREVGPGDKRTLGRVGDYIDGLGKSLTQVQGWVLASAVGLHPTSYRRLQRTMGRHIRYIGGNDRILRDAQPSLSDARWALTQVAEMAFRLREQGALIEGTEDAVFRRRHGLSAVTVQERTPDP